MSSEAFAGFGNLFVCPFCGKKTKTVSLLAIGGFLEEVENEIEFRVECSNPNCEVNSESSAYFLKLDEDGEGIASYY